MKRNGNEDPVIRCPKCGDSMAIGCRAGRVLWRCRRGHELATDNRVLCRDFEPVPDRLPEPLDPTP